jgi:ketosteroid isomerase-like protein
MLAMYADDAVFDLSAVFTDMTPVHGHADIRRHWDRMWEIWGGLRMDVREVHEGNNGRYAVQVRLWGVGRESGAAVDQLFAMLYTIGPDGKASSAQLLPDMEAAVRAATPHT